MFKHQTNIKVGVAHHTIGEAMTGYALKTLKRNGYSRLIFLSCIAEPRSKVEITRMWNLSESSRPLYRDKVNDEIQQMKEYGTIKEEGNKLKADITAESFTEMFSTVLTKKLQSNGVEDFNEVSQRLGTLQVFTPLVNNHEDYLQFLDRTEIREVYFSEETLQDFFKSAGSQKMAELGRENFWKFFYGLYLGVLLKTVLQMMDDESVDNKFKMLVFSLLMSNPLISDVNIEGLTGKDILEKEDFRKMEELHSLEKDIKETIEKLGKAYPDTGKLIN